MVELAVIIPTLNERQNIAPIVERLTACLDGVAWEAIFVDDDSPDGTADECRRISAINPRIRVVHRVGRRGLASACIEGMLASSAPYLAVMDGDMQHDETILPQMLATAKQQHADVVIGSRNIGGGGMGAFAKERVQLSNLGRRLSQAVTAQDLSDPMSGFFLITRNFLNQVIYQIQGIGFKILLDLVSSTPEPIKIVEVPYVFRNRQYGESKLDFTVGFEYLVLLIGKLIRYTIPLTFASFALVGVVGLFLYWGILAALFQTGTLPFVQSAVIATGVAMVSNFVLNNFITHRAYRLKGWRSILSGLVVFVGACSIGALANIAVSQLLLRSNISWFWAGTTGIVIGSVWNYSVTGAFIWHIDQRRTRARAARRSAILSSSENSASKP